MIRRIKLFINNRIVKNAGWLIISKVAQMLISLVVSLLTARYLGPSNYGLIGYATAFTSFFTAICNLGINSVLVKEFIDKKYDEGQILGTSLVLKAISSFFSAITIVIIVSVIDAGETVTIVVVVLTSIGLICNVFDTLNYWFQSRLQSKVTAIATLVGYTITSLYKVYLIVNNYDVTYFALANSIDYLCVGILLVLFYKKYKGGKFNFSFDYGRQLLKKSYHFILPGLMVAVYAQTDKMMLKQMINTSEIGYYSTAISICTMWCFILNAIIDSAYPSIMEANKTDYDTFRRRNKQLYAVVFYFSILVSLFLTLLSEPIIKILYGEEFLEAAKPLRIATWYTAFSYLGVARNAWIVCKDKQRYLKYIYFASAVSNVLLNYCLIPPFGASGAALASFAAQLFTTLFFPLFISEMKENSVMMIEAITLKDVFSKSH